MKKIFQRIKKNRKKIFYVLLFSFIALQFIRPEKNAGKAESVNDISHFTSVPAEVKNGLVTGCYDCHSDSTYYPWYNNIEPVGWWLSDHVKDGKRALNFSQFNTYGIQRKMKKLKQIADVIRDNEMPLNSYLWIHHDAKFSEQQKNVIMDWAIANRKDLELKYPDSIPTERKK